MKERHAFCSDSRVSLGGTRAERPAPSRRERAKAAAPRSPALYVARAARSCEIFSASADVAEPVLPFDIASLLMG